MSVAATLAPAAPSTAQDPIRVMIVDDAVVVRGLVSRWIDEEAGLKTDLRWVRDGEELMDYLLRRGDYADASKAPRPVIILLDLNMPKKDGREALKEIKAHPDLRTISVLTRSSRLTRITG